MLPNTAFEIFVLFSPIPETDSQSDRAPVFAHDERRRLHVSSIASTPMSVINHPMGATIGPRSLKDAQSSSLAIEPARLARHSHDETRTMVTKHRARQRKRRPWVAMPGMPLRLVTDGAQTFRSDSILAVVSSASLSHWKRPAGPSAGEIAESCR